MSKKQQQPADDKPDVIAFKEINLAIDGLLKRLAVKGMCPCCVAQGMLWRGALLHQEIVGADETVSLCMDLADAIEQPDDAIPTSSTQH